MVTIRSHFGTGIQKSSVGIFWDQDHDSNACFMKPDGAIVRILTAGASTSTASRFESVGVRCSAS